MHGENEQASFLECAVKFGFVDLEYCVRRGQRASRFGLVIWIVVSDSVDGKFK